jgi:hypothetical protein
VMDETRCCADCFSDDYLVKLVREHGTPSSSRCFWCGSPRQRSVELAELTEPMRSVVERYFVRYEDLAQSGHIDATDGEYIGDLLSQELQAISDNVSKRNDLANAILNHGLDYTDGDRTYDDDQFWFRREDDASYPDLTEELDDALDTLREAVWKHGHSLSAANTKSGIRPSPIVSEAIGLIRKELKLHKVTLPKGAKVFRARVEDDPIDDLSQLHAPLAHRVPAARANLSGQPVLYVADSLETALSEVRPAIGDLVVVGELKLRRAVRLCDLVRRGVALSPFEDLARHSRACAKQNMRAALGKEFASPIRPRDTARDYLFSQYVAQLIRRLGFDGLAFASSQHQSYPDAAINYVLFDTSAAVATAMSRHSVCGVEYNSFPVREDLSAHERRRRRVAGGP